MSNSALTKSQKKEWAKQLYTQGQLTQMEVAEKVGVTRQTVSKWITTEEWDKYKISLLLTRQEELSKLYRQLEDLNGLIMERDKGERHATVKEADIISKLGSAIKKLENETDVSTCVSVFSELIQWARSVDVSMVKTLAPILDQFIKYKM